MLSFSSTLAGTIRGPHWEDHPVANTASDSASTQSGLDGLLDPINRALEQACQFESGCPAVLGDAIRYALLSPGKRLRPAMTLMATEACGGEMTKALPAAVAVEMIHAYSLIHDDLPAMDDDDLRRGRPTVHIQFNEAIAILAGDALQAEAFAQLTSNLPDPLMAAEAVGVLSRAAGAARLVGGQVDDLAAEQFAPGQRSEDPDRTLRQLESIHRRKTGALLAAALDLGSLVAGADDQTRRSLSDYASDVGLAFQIVDDLLDFTATAADLGKRAGKDDARGKLTYPGLLGIEQARRLAEQLVESAKRHTAVFGPAGWRLSWLADYVLERKH